MAIPVPQKRAFKNVFKPKRGRVYKPKATQVGDTPVERRQHRWHAGSKYPSPLQVPCS